MSQYHCPFCSSLYQLHKTRSDGILVCAHCGDPLIKKASISLRQIFGLVALSGFLTPLLIMILFIIKDFNKENPKSTSEAYVRLTRLNNGK